MKLKLALKSKVVKDFHAARQNCLASFSGLAIVAMPANCVLSAKIKFLREKRSTTQENPAIAVNGC